MKNNIEEIIKDVNIPNYPLEERLKKIIDAVRCEENFQLVKFLSDIKSKMDFYERNKEKAIELLHKV